MEFNVNLKKARESAGLTQQQVADRLGITKSTYCNYEIGKREPDVEKIKKIAKALGISADDLLETGYNKSNAPALSTEALRLANDYERLDKWGQKQVRSVANNELERMENDERFFQDLEFDSSEEKVINIFTNPAAAGPALGETGQDCEPYTLKADDPQGAEYGVRVQGDSMEPYFKDGSIAFVNHDQMTNGDVGVFCVDGATVIKQWYSNGEATFLFSLNRKRKDCDLVIAPGSGQQLVWQGKVITRRHFELPPLYVRII